MQEFIIFLRGINVGGHRKILMKDLKTLLQENNFFDVKTYIQSGNIYLKSIDNLDEIKLNIQNIILNHFGFEVLSFVLTGGQIRNILKNSPYENHDGEQYYTLTDANITNESWDKLVSLNNSTDVISYKDLCIYLLCKNGYGNTKFSNPFIEKRLNVNATTRNRKTIQVMVDLLD
jgi:uncharacterized protein (DUF1697 family)